MKKLTRKNVQIDHINNKIFVSKAFYRKASNYGTAEYRELHTAMKENPAFVVELKETEKNTYAGLKISLIKDYIAMQKNADELLKEFTNIRDLGEACNAKYPMIKKWFCETFKGVTAEEVKKAVNDYFYRDAKAAAVNQTADSDEATTEKIPA